MGRGWHRVRTPPGVQTWQNADGGEVGQADVAGDQQLRHAKEQLTLASQYPGGERSLPKRSER